MTNEERLRKLEEIVIKLETLFESLLIKYQDELNAVNIKVSKNTKDIEEIQTTIYSSCDTMNTKVDKKINDSLIKAFAGIMLLFGLFVGAVVYMNGEHGHIHEKVNTVNASVVGNGTNIVAILNTINKIDAKLDKATAQRYYIQDNLIKAK